MGTLYKLTAPNGKSYIGITSQPLKSRMRAHRGAANLGRSGLLLASIRKYGFSSFVVETLTQSEDWEALKEMEVRAIAKHCTLAPRGLNLTKGGDGVLGVVVTAEQRVVRSVSQKRSYQDPVRKARHLASQRSSQIRRSRSEITKQRLSDPNERIRISDAMKRRWKDPKYLEKMRRRAHRPSINDGLTKWQRYRLKDLAAYRAKKRILAAKYRALKKAALDTVQK
jgi:hypothetical protein